MRYQRPDFVPADFVPLLGIALAVLGSACSDPFGFSAEPVEGEEVCAASSEWLPNTPALDQFKPLPHPATECPFYRGGWQNFLVAMQPDADGRPAMLSYPTIDTMFEPALPRAETRSELGDIRQAGGRQVLIDQNGNSLYYGIHVNQAYADFLDAHGLHTREDVENASPRLFFPPGVVEFKSAWQIVEDGDSSDDYITITTTVPTLSQDGDRIIEDRDTPREVRARLLALHVVFTLPGHPEFIWATFEHSTGTPDTKAADGKRNVAPASVGNPNLEDPNNLQDDSVISPDDHLLYHGGTAANSGNQAIAETDLVLDEATQKFANQQTSIYRMFPASKSNTIDPDDAISSLNHNVEALFAQAAGSLDPADRRSHYRMVGAVWMDKPAYYDENSALQNDETSPFFDEDGFVDDIKENGSDSDFSILAGEDRLSSTAMESFTQAPDSFPNCFTCHNTQAVTAKGVPIDRDSSGVQLLEPKLLNVSHVLSQFILEETQAEAAAGEATP
ncbi:MAG TPA: hypothetical protein VKB80_07375 [Kofleriaceae bacterium]|nr:hypothetical protein [Kofleriaceae bacterium]